jgi:hypothetical protein
METSRSDSSGGCQELWLEVSSSLVWLAGIWPCRCAGFVWFCFWHVLGHTPCLRKNILEEQSPVCCLDVICVVTGTSASEQEASM